MKFNWAIFYVLCTFLGTSIAFHSTINEAEECCKMGRYSQGPLCNLDLYSNRNTTSELCKSSFNLCCQKQKAQRDCTAGIAAAMSNQNCWALGHPIDYQTCCSLCNIGKHYMYAMKKCNNSKNIQFPEQVRMECCENLFKPLTDNGDDYVEHDDSEDDDDVEMDLPCISGFNRDLRTLACVDIDECASGEHNCRHFDNCVNTNGSFYCDLTLKCDRGYRINEIGSKCEDIDECRENNPCRLSEDCINTQGRFRCEKKICSTKGFYFNETTLRCEDIDECLRNPCRGYRKCINYAGGFSCECEDGYRYEEFSNSCVDIDECTEFPYLCDHKCINFRGTYRCSCKRGFSLSKRDNHTCEDIDECALRGGDLCMGTCNNNIGSYQCECPSGFTLEGGIHCKDINECADSKICGRRQKCVNTYGSHQCFNTICDSGYKRNSRTKECLLLNHSLCYKKGANSNEIDASSESECRIPLIYNHTFMNFQSSTLVPQYGRVIFQYLFFKNPWKYDAEIKIFDSKPLENKPMILAMKNDFKIEQSHTKLTVKLMKALEGPQEIQIYIWIKPKYGWMIGQKLHIFTSSSYKWWNRSKS